MSEPENENNTPDASEIWARERDARIASDKERLDAQLGLLENAYSGIEAQYNALERAEGYAHDELNTRAIVRVQAEKARLLGEAEQLRYGYSTLHQQKAALDNLSEINYDTMLQVSSPPSQMMLRAYRDKLENNQAAMRKLLFEHNVAVAKNITPDTAEYFRHLENAMGFSADDRKTGDFDDEPSNQPNTYKFTERKSKPKVSEAQKAMANAIPGVSPDDYLAACAQPFSQAHSATVEIDDAGNFDSRTNKPLTVSLDEPKKPSVDATKYKPGPSSVNLSKTELDLIDNMAVQAGKPVSEMRKEFAAQKLALHSGRAGHYMLYDKKMASEGHR